MVKKRHTYKRRSAGSVAILTYPELRIFEYGIAVELFALQRPGLGMDWYSVDVIAASPGKCGGLGAVSVAGQRDLTRLRNADTIVVPGWFPIDQQPRQELLHEIVLAYQRGAQLFSICTGSYLLAYAGILAGKSATTHWLWFDDFRKRFPAVSLDENALYVDEGKIITSAGSAAGMDAGLHLFRREFGASVANLIARRMVMAPHRDGGQAQFVPPPYRDTDRSPLSGTMLWMRENLSRDLSVARIAKQAAMSQRTLLRQFIAHNGCSPAAWLRKERVGAARELLEQTSLDLEQVAARVGFGSMETFRAAFRRVAKTSPVAYRRRFGKTLTDRTRAS